MWQDIVFTVGGVLFFFALLPTLIGKNKPALGTSLVTGVLLFMFALTYMSMGMIFSSLATGLTSASWITIAAQTRWARKRDKAQMIIDDEWEADHIRRLRVMEDIADQTGWTMSAHDHAIAACDRPYNEGSDVLFRNALRKQPQSTVLPDDE